MKAVRPVLLALLLGAAPACTSGGGGGPTVTTVPAPNWPKFRHDQSNSGLGGGLVETNPGAIKWQVEIDQAAPAAPISSSPAVDADGTIYIGTEGGTLAAVDPLDGTLKWSTASCDFTGGNDVHACSAGSHPLGAIISSPAIFTFNSRTSIFIGSADGRFFTFEDDGVTRTCSVCFQPVDADVAPDATITSSRFISSPTFFTSTLTGAVAGIFLGAEITVMQGEGSRTLGKLYALNTDGSLKWQFPQPSDAGEIGGITSSPALGVANTLYFLAADDNLYAVTSGGTFKWKFPAGTARDPSAPFATSPLTSTLIYTGTAAGAIVAINPDGTFRWQVTSPDQSALVSSLAIGLPAATTPTPIPTLAPTATQEPAATATPTVTPTPVPANQAVFGVTTSGMVIVINTFTGEIQELTGPLAPIAGPVMSSPALSADSFLVLGTSDGTLHAVNTTTGAEPSGWPVRLAEGVAIRSSPAIARDGTVYVGGDDGKLYAVGVP
ncbi:MAG: PQQ-binding-like beta-propeller repeat protein [Candidatus Binatia bacterium]